MNEWMILPHILRTCLYSEDLQGRRLCLFSPSFILHLAQSHVSNLLQKITVISLWLENHNIHNNDMKTELSPDLWPELILKAENHGCTHGLRNRLGVEHPFKHVLISWHCANRHFTPANFPGLILLQVVNYIRRKIRWRLNAEKQNITH